jgi:hypothetical protein
MMADAAIRHIPANHMQLLRGGQDASLYTLVSVVV